MRPFFASIPALLPLFAVAEPIGRPNPQLLPVTRAVHEVITRTPDLAVEEMRQYVERPPLANNGGSFEMLPIPGGTFTIGSPDTEAGRLPHEGPRREIAIEPFWMAKLEITWDLYEPFMRETLSRNKDGTLNRDADQKTSEPAEMREGETLLDIISQPTAPHGALLWGMGDGFSKEYPVINATPHAANKFCEWLSAQTGHFYRLPTEAEWEYACRAGTETAYHFGDDPAELGDYAWFKDNSEFQYQKVGKKKPNPWGLHDMHGNVAELVLDQYFKDAYGRHVNGAVNPFFPALERYRTSTRGGHWQAEAAGLRSAAREGSHPEWKMIDPQIPKSIWYFTGTPWLGFRIVRPLKTPSLEETHLYWNTGPGSGEQDLPGAPPLVD